MRGQCCRRSSTPSNQTLCTILRLRLGVLLLRYHCRTATQRLQLVALVAVRERARFLVQITMVLVRVPAEVLGVRIRRAISR